MSKYDDIEVARKDLPELAVAVAKELGEGWRHDDETVANHWYANIFGPDGEYLMVGVDSYKPKTHIDISGWMPGDLLDSGAYLRDLETISIKVGKDRGTATIAKEISRRLLPQYQENLRIARDRAKQSLADRAERDRAVTVVAALLGVEPPRPRLGTNPDQAVYVYSPGRVGVAVRKGGQLSFEVTGQVDLLRGVLAELGRL
ncbi:hypothetical protein [Micromonospora sp. NBC_01813]|uniref:hypothetical protein n=1 Tax=Micromonospora sp. NBC_01813 TaxID=2975988 RepID=UPI002DD9B445|nr:hypothetical protein [Micromonospora sp. NBC_01813]WSA11524.1 hypothetical protein OG958_12500 [Micromonospora sp. NBC_01813]